MSVAPLPEGTRVGSYQLTNVISSGGFAIVYLGQDKRSGERVAIKEYMPGALATRDPGKRGPEVKTENLQAYRIGLKGFFDEARTLSTIKHHNIVHVLDFVHENETVYMIMRYVDGRSLQDQLKRNRVRGESEVMTESFIRRVFVDVLTGLREVHNNRVLHLDLKPANIYLMMDGTPIILDFGAARQTLERDISKIYPMYTPGFAAPEQYKRDAEVGPWTDVYGIGACIYACMSGKAVQEAYSRMKNDTVPAELRALRGMYSNELISITQSCLSLNSLERPKSASDLQQLLLKRVPKETKTSLLDNAMARVGKIQVRVTKFCKDNNITWY